MGVWEAKEGETKMKKQSEVILAWPWRDRNNQGAFGGQWWVEMNVYVWLGPGEGNTSTCVWTAPGKPKGMWHVWNGPGKGKSIKVRLDSAWRAQTNVHANLWFDCTGPQTPNRGVSVKKSESAFEYSQAMKSED